MIKTMFSKENLPLTVVVILVAMGWLSFLSVILANL
jgi:hypothetical protein